MHRRILQIGTPSEGASGARGGARGPWLARPRRVDRDDADGRALVLLALVVLSCASVASAACSSSASLRANDGGRAEAGAADCFACADGGTPVLPAAVRVKGVLDQICANPDGCHGAGAGTLGISIGRERLGLVGVPSWEAPDLLRVKPGDPAESYLYRKIACDGGIADGGCMPSGSGLEPVSVRAFFDWIEAGAPAFSF
jgi:hypothetical protein